jgi:hypothetical protein
MRLSKWALASAISGVLCAGTAYAQSGVQQPSTIQRTAFEYSSYYAQDDNAATPSPSDTAAPAAAAPEAPAPAASCNCAPAAAPAACAECSDNCPEGRCFGGPFNPCCKLTDPWKLFDCEGLKCRNVNIAGYVAQSFTGNPQNPSDGFNGPLTWTDRSNQYELNQFLTYIERPTNTGGAGWDFGGRADVMIGTDYRFNTESGLETRGQFSRPKISDQRFYGTAFTQFYFEVARNNLKIKIGHFYSPVGYEGVQTIGNFFTTLPYTFQYGEPFTHTGALATWTVNEKLTVGTGLIRGWDNFGNNNPNIGAINTFTRTFDDKSSLAIVQVFSNEPNQMNNVNTGVPGNNNAHSFRFLQTNVYSRPLTRISEKLNYVAQSDWGYQTRALLNDKTAHYYGLNQYLFYKVSDCWSWGLRGEWFRDEEGFRVGGFQGATNSTAALPPADQSLRGLSANRGGYNGNFYEITLGANYKPNANTVIRPMVRFDWYQGGQSGFVNPGYSPALGANSGGDPYDAGRKNQQFIYGLDYITLF